MNPPATVLVTGATGYIGGRLAPRLLAEGHRVHVLARSAARVRSRSWAERVEIVEGDALDRETLAQALAGVVLDYLAAALTNAACGDKVIEIGGQGVTTYKGMMLGYARARGLRRWLVPVPVLTPRLSSYWVHWITPIPSRVSGPLIDGLRNEVVETDHLARELFPAISPRDYAGAISEVIEDLEQGRVETAWSDAHGGSDTPDSFSRVESHEGMIFERRTRQVGAPAREVYRVFTGIGGERGWFYGDWMWRVRGMVDRLLGGARLRAGIPTSCASATRWISGGWRPWSRIGWSGSGRR